jgi:hypothetical protein
MPTAITGQNGAQVKQVTRVAVSGCPEREQAGKKVERKTQRAAGKKVKPRAARRR